MFIVDLSCNYRMCFIIGISTLQMQFLLFPIGFRHIYNVLQSSPLAMTHVHRCVEVCSLVHKRMLTGS